MAARHQVLLGGEHDMAIVRAIGSEEGEERALLAFVMGTLGITVRHFIIAHRIGRDSRCILNETSLRLSESQFSRAKARHCISRGFDRREVVVA